MKLPKPIFVILLILLYGCGVTTNFSPQYLTFPLVYSAKFSFKPDTTTILLINRYSPDKKITLRKLKVLKEGAFTAIKYAKTGLSDLPHVKVINLVDAVSLNVNTDSISSLATKYHSDYVLALTDYGADIFLDGVESGSAYYNSEVNVKFTLFEGNGIYKKKLEGATNIAQSIQPYLGLIPSLIIHPTIAGNKDSINSASKNAALVALQDYLPHTVTLKRPLYNHVLLKPALNEILAGNFDKADSLAQPFLHDKNPVIACKAAYNLAVVYEAEGDINGAIGMAQFSLEKYKNGYASALLNDLKKE
jgi:hypothetical protein